MEGRPWGRGAALQEEGEEEAVIGGRWESTSGVPGYPLSQE